MTLADLEKLQLKAIELDGQPIPGVHMTESQFETWLDDDIRAEWINGEVIMMSPASTDHVELNLWLATLIQMFADSRDLGKVFGIETQVRFQNLKRRRNPDLLFLSTRNLKLIRETYIDGAPDLIIELVSPDSEARDWRDKFIDYQAAGVREYWVIDRNSNRVEAYSLHRKRYVRIPETNERIASKVLGGFYIRPKWLWSSPLPKVAGILKELGV